MRCPARSPHFVGRAGLLTVPTRSPTSSPTACTIFELLSDTLDIAYNTLTSKNGLLCLLVLNARAGKCRRSKIWGTIGRFYTILKRRNQKSAWLLLFWLVGLASALNDGSRRP